MTVTDEFQFLVSDAEFVGRTASMPEVSRVYFTADSGRKVAGLKFVDHAMNAGDVIVFLHGAGLNAHTFDRTILALPARGEIAAIYSLDLPGHGKSDWREDATYSPENLAADIATVIPQFLAVDQQVHLIGHSLGGLTAARVASLIAERCKSLTVIDITPGISPSKDAGSINDFITGKKVFDSIEEMVDRAIEFKIGSDRAALRRGVTLNTRLRDDGSFEWAHHFAHLPGLAAGASAAPADPLPYASIWKDLVNFKGILTLVRGTTGMVSERMLQEWENKTPNSRAITVEAGHNVHEHNPLNLASEIAMAIRQSI